MTLPLIPVLLLASLLAAAPSPDVGVRVSGKPVLVGLPLTLELDVPGVANASLQFPPAGAEYDSFLFLEGRRDGDEVSCSLLPTLSGLQTIPSMTLVVRLEQGAPFAMHTRPIDVSVRTALKPSETPRLQDDLPLERFSGFRAVLLWWLLLPVLLAALALFVRRKRRRPVERRREIVRTRPFDPEGAALRELTGLLERELAPGEPARLLLADLADTLRRYLSARVEAMSMVRTLEEFEPLLVDLLGEGEGDLPRALFRDADLAKFSGAAPAPAVVGTLLDRSVRFVRARSGESSPEGVAR